MPDKNAQINFQLSQDLRRRLKVYAARKGVAVSELLREKIREMLQEDDANE